MQPHKFAMAVSLAAFCLAMPVYGAAPDVRRYRCEVTASYYEPKSSEKYRVHLEIDTRRKLYRQQREGKAMGKWHAMVGDMWAFTFDFTTLRGRESDVNSDVYDYNCSNQ
jgi:hypothetical protein